MKTRRRAITFAVWAVLLALAVYLVYRSDQPAPQVVSFERFRQLVAGQQVAAVAIRGPRLEVTLRSGARAATVGSLDDELYDALEEQNAAVSFDPGGGSWQDALAVWVPVAVVVALVLFFLQRNVRRNGLNLAALRRSRHRSVTEKTGVRFADVGGCEDAKRQLGDVVDFLADPERWTRAGVRAPRGVLLEGPPGCGKTLLARAVAGETEARFLTVSGSEFVELFVGVGAARVRDLFETAAKQAPAVVFIDELDAIGRRRGSGLGLSNDEREATLNQLLVNLDGFEPADRIIVIAATNRPDILDAALVRAGRFDRRIRVPALTRESRLQVLEIHSRAKSLAAGVSLPSLADRTDGMTGAELETLVNEAGLLSLRRARESGDGDSTIRSEDFARALAQRADGQGRLAPLDVALIDSSHKLTEPVGTARLRVTLQDGTALEGDLVWADGSFLKLRRGPRDAGGETVIPKRQILTLEALDPSDAAAPPTLRLTIGADAGRPA